MDREELRQRATKTLAIAKENLDQYGNVAPMLITFSPDGRQKVTPVPDKYLVGGILNKEKPDAFIYVAEAWVKGHTPEEQELVRTKGGAEELQRRIKERKVPLPSQDPSRQEGILIIGGSGAVRVSLTQQFRREKDKVVFDEHAELSDIAVGDSLVDWEDVSRSRGSKPDDSIRKWDMLLNTKTADWSNTISAAPSGGRIVKFDQPHIEIWVPEGWRMGFERTENPSEKAAYWYRERGSHGILRVTHTKHPQSSLSESGSTPSRAAKEFVERCRAAGAKDLNSVETPERYTISFNQVLQRPAPHKTFSWAIFDRMGMFVVTFSCELKMRPADLADELTSVSEVVKRVDRGRMPYNDI